MPFKRRGSGSYPHRVNLDHAFPVLTSDIMKLFSEL